MEKEGVDRKDLKLPGQQLQLLQDATKAGECQSKCAAKASLPSGAVLQRLQSAAGRFAGTPRQSRRECGSDRRELATPAPIRPGGCLSHPLTGRADTARNAESPALFAAVLHPDFARCHYEMNFAVSPKAFHIVLSQHKSTIILPTAIMTRRGRKI